MDFNDIDLITLESLQQLVSLAIKESKTLEFKQSIMLEKDEHKKEFLYDISSFANTEGGTIIYGISENRESGCLKELIGLEGNIDQLILKVEGILRDGIDPRLEPIKVKTVQLQNGNHVLILKIQKSKYLPHQVVFGKANKFYYRNNSGKSIMNTAEIRNAILNSEKLNDKVDDFKSERISLFSKDSTIVKLGGFGKIAIHLIPIMALNSNKQYDFALLKSSNVRIAPVGLPSNRQLYNLDGIAVVSYLHTTAEIGGGFIQIYKNGIIETVTSSTLLPYENKTEIPSYKGRNFGLNFENDIINSLNEYLNIIKTLKIEFPISCYITFINVKGYSMASDKIHWRTRKPPEIDREIIKLPEIILASLEADIAKLCKPAFDAIWNACGLEGSQNYDVNGNWGQ